MGSSLLHRRVYMRQAYAIAAWGEIIYRVDGCLAVPQCRYLTYSHAFSYGICLNLKKSDMETKSTNEVKGDYDRVSASECLGSLIELHGIVMEDDLFVIPDADGTAVLYNDGKIRFDEIADIEVGSVFVGILLRNGYLFYLSRTEPLKTCIYTHGGWGSISEISPRGIAGHIGRELHGKLGDHTAVD